MCTLSTGFSPALLSSLTSEIAISGLAPGERCLAASTVPRQGFGSHTVSYHNYCEEPEKKKIEEPEKPDNSQNFEAIVKNGSNKNN